MKYKIRIMISKIRFDSYVFLAILVILINTSYNYSIIKYTFTFFYIFLNKEYLKYKA